MPEEFLRKIDEYEENIRLNIVKKDFKDLGNKEITGKIYVVLDQKNNEEEIVINSGDYATISSIGHFDGEEGRKVLLELLSWIKENKILILDDSTSALDMETEHELLKNLSNRKHESTTFIIAHRISAVKNADLIIYLEDGQIKESGTHDELLKKKGRYYDIYNDQFRDFNLLEEEVI